MTHDDALAAALAPLLTGPGTPDDLRQALDHVAGRLRTAFRAGFAAVRAVPDDEDMDDVRGVSFADASHARVFGPALSALPADASGVAASDLGSGRAVLAADALAHPALAAVADRLGAAGVEPGELRGALRGASALVMPLSTSSTERLGSVVIVSGPGDGPLGEDELHRLEALAPVLGAAVQNALLRDRHRRSLLTLEAVLAATPNGVWVVDRRGRLAVANRAVGGLVGVDFAPFLGRPVREEVAPALSPRFTDPGFFERRIGWLLDHPGERGDDTLETVDGRILESHSAPVRDAHGTLIGRVMIVSDVTEERGALAEARLLADEKARLLAREERRLEEEAALARAAQAMATALTRADVHDRLLDQALGLFWVDRAALFVADRAGRVTMAAARGVDGDAASRLELRRDEEPMGRLLAGGTVLCGDARDDPATAALLGGRGLGSFVAVPMTAGERVYGVFCAGSSRAGAFGERELRMLEELTRLGSAALRNALLYEQERHVAETLQQALLAQEVPSFPGLRVGVLYRAAAGALVGGDLYSVWRLPGGAVAVLVADVSGKGVEAAGVTAMVRHMAEALSISVSRPDGLLAALDRLLAERLPDGRLVTAFLAVVDAAAGTLGWSSAGHPPPVLLRARGGVEVLEDPGPPLGALTGGGVFRGHETPFAPGDLLFLHTDGLAEARRGDEPWGEERLRAAVVDARDQAPDRLATTVYAAAREWASGRLSDDVAIAVVGREP